ncbi:aminoglycoside 6-adenylyltransferase [Alteribacillus sp. HJP-4]|uniref:aminoglycoside 6-adenylyltransferase n=1 Tax=Alteribacillus sp. HJP-4 TaxID=2775394 RepID=UPI0035CD192A
MNLWVHYTINDENVVAVFYGGSIGNQNTDLYSDIDLRIVVIDEVFEEYRLNKKERAKNWGNVLYFEDFPWATYTVAHYDSFIKVDAFYYKTENIQPSTWLQNISVVYDKTGFMGEILEKSKKLLYSPTVQEVEMWRTKYFAYVHEAYRRVNRKEMFYALNCLDNLRLSMVTAWYMDKGIQPNAFGDWAKYEGERSELDNWQLSLLASWHSSRDPNDLMSVIERMLPEFKKTHKGLCEKLDMEENSEWIDEIFGMVF